MTSPGHIWTHHAVAPTKRSRQGIEITALAGQAMEAKQDSRVVGISPLPIGQLEQLPRPQTLHMVQPRLNCQSVHG